MTSTESGPVILVAIDWYLPAFRAGGPVRSIANLVANLGDRFDFRIVCGHSDLGEDHDLGMPQDQWVPQGKAQVRYLAPEQCTATEWRRIIEDIQPDRLYINSLYSGPFSRLPWRVAREMGLPTTLAPRGMLGPGALAIKPWRKRLWLTLQRWTGRYDGLHWHASTPQEADEIRQWFPSAKVHVALNLPVPFDPLPAAASEGRLVLLSIGRIHPIKNYSLGLELAKALVQSGRPVTYRIVGPVEDAEERRRLEAQSEGVDLELVGPRTPDEIRDFFADAHLVLVPSLNENFGHTVAEAIAAARPVIVSDQTAWAHLDGGPTVRCVPLDPDLWHQAARSLLNLKPEEILEHSASTFGRCLLDEPHLAAQRHLFEA